MEIRRDLHRQRTHWNRASNSWRDSLVCVLMLMQQLIRHITIAPSKRPSSLQQICRKARRICMQRRQAPPPCLHPPQPPHHPSPSTIPSVHRITSANRHPSSSSPSIPMPTMTPTPTAQLPQMTRKPPPPPRKRCAIHRWITSVRKMDTCGEPSTAYCKMEFSTFTAILRMPIPSKPSQNATKSIPCRNANNRSRNSHIISRRLICPNRPCHGQNCFTICNMISATPITTAATTPRPTQHTCGKNVSTWMLLVPSDPQN
mmetsp:Transcript_9249/g.26411  ORF Transcript_9249/g.26411 Transcript_9249/m.26411 type:complete len:259 (+) Transcript_9249:925-1701(+)